MAEIIFLGTSSSIPTKKRDNTSFVFLHKKEPFLVDCPGAIVHKLIKVGINFKKLKKVILTHQHPDHIYGIISLIHTQACFNDELTIFSNPDCINIVKKLIKIFGLDKKHYPVIKYVNVFKNNYFLLNNNLKVKAIKNHHIENSFGIKINFGKKSIFFSSDTSFSRQMLKKVGKINYLIHDCTASSSYFSRHPSLYRMHTHSRQLAEYLEKTKSTKLIPIHFLILNNRDEKKIKGELESLGRKVLFVNDLERLSI